jgi:hypothetical protein
MQTPAELVPQATTFAVISFLGASTMMSFNFLAAILRAIGDSRTPLVFLTLSCLLNIALVIALVAGLGFGVGGAAFASVISQATSVGLCLVHVQRRVQVLHPHHDDWRVTRDDVARHLRIGLPMGFQASIIAIGALAVQVRLNSLGAEAVAAYTTAVRVDGLAVALLASLGLAVSTFVAQNYGAGRPDRIRLGVRQAAGMAVVGALLLAAVLITAGSSIIGLFVGPGEQQVVAMASFYLQANGACYLLLVAGARGHLHPDADGGHRARDAGRCRRRARRGVRIQRGRVGQPSRLGRRGGRARPRVPAGPTALGGLARSGCRSAARGPRVRGADSGLRRPRRRRAGPARRRRPRIDPTRVRFRGPHALTDPASERLAHPASFLARIASADRVMTP